MKHILVTAAMLIGSAAYAQESTSGADASANNINANQSGSIAYAGNTYLTPSDTKARIESAPAVSAPAVFGGGHPCLAGKSGGVSVIGGGLSYGQGDPEPACMAWVMGQPEVAIRIMMATSPAFCEAMNNVGYYRVGNAVVPVACGKQTRRGGIDTPGVESRPSRVSTKNRVNYAPQAVCNRSGGKLKFSIDAHFANKDAARANCKARLKG